MDVLNTILKKIPPKLVIFLSTYWVLSVAIAIWFGLGWFFLMVTLRRLMIAFPFSRNWINRVTGVEKPKSESNGTLIIWHNILQTFIIVIWLSLTIVVFLKANIRLSDVLR
jgi:hypothetical protein